VILFKGRVTSIDSCGRTQAKVSVESDPTLLKMQMPWKTYGPNCQWQLYGPGCTLNRATYTFTGAVGAGSTASLINWSSASAQFQQGTLTFTSGANEGISTNIKTATSSSLVPMYPLPSAPATGDTFTAVWGCDHTLGAQFTGAISGTTLTVSTQPIGVILNGPLNGVGVDPGQTVTGQLTGSPPGGIGTYTVSIPQTLASVSMSTGQGCGKFFNYPNFEGFPFVPPPQIVSGPMAVSADGSKD
jgi:hypothetical protein